MNCIKLCLITAITWYANRKTTRKKRSKKSKKDNFLANVEEEEKKTEILTNHNTSTKTHILQQTNHQLRRDITGKNLINYKELDGYSQQWE